MALYFVLVLCFTLLSNAFARDVKKCTKQQIDAIEGWLFDLDGCLYTPAGLIDGTQKLMDWLEQSKKPFVLLSNSFRSKKGVTQKFNKSKKYFVTQDIREDQVHTAALALAKYMEETAVDGAKIFVVNTDISYSDGLQENVVSIMKDNVPKEKFSKWVVRTALSDDEIKKWAEADGQKFVVQAFMGNPNNAMIGDPLKGPTSPNIYTTMDYNLMKKIHLLLEGGAQYVVGAPDAVDAQPKSKKYKDIDTSWPTMGGYEQYFLRSAEIFEGTAAYTNYANTGKGGNKGVQYMINKGVEMLKKVKPDIKKENIAMVGDNLGTDIKAGNEAGLKSILVLTGAHQLEDAQQAHNPAPTCYMDNVGVTADISPVTTTTVTTTTVTTTTVTTSSSSAFSISTLCILIATAFALTVHTGL